MSIIIQYYDNVNKLYHIIKYIVSGILLNKLMGNMILNQILVQKNSCYA